MLLALLLAAAPTDTVRYTVSFPNAVHHEARIVAEFPAAGRAALYPWCSATRTAGSWWHAGARCASPTRSSAIGPGVEDSARPTERAPNRVR
jgi:hypothetical protein